MQIFPSLELNILTVTTEKHYLLLLDEWLWTASQVYALVEEFYVFNVYSSFLSSRKYRNYCGDFHILEIIITKIIIVYKLI